MDPIACRPPQKHGSDSDSTDRAAAGCGGVARVACAGRAASFAGPERRRAAGKSVPSFLPVAWTIQPISRIRRRSAGMVAVVPGLVGGSAVPRNFCPWARRRFRATRKLLPLCPSEVPRGTVAVVPGLVGGSALPGNFCHCARRRSRRARWQSWRARRRFRATQKLLSLGSSEVPRCLVAAVSGRWGSPRRAETFVPDLVGGSALPGVGGFWAVGKSAAGGNFRPWPRRGSAPRGGGRAGAVGKSAGSSGSRALWSTS